MRREFLLLLIVAAPLVAGCRARPAPQPVPQAPPVQLLAYINVSSGCQQATVDFLQVLQATYPRLAVELVDFGDGGAGSERWQLSGHRCLTIEIDGHNPVKFPFEGKTKVVDFRMPPGVLWEHGDLEQAVQAAIAGTLQPATEDEIGGDPAQTEQKMEQMRSKAGGKPAPAPPAKADKKDLRPTGAAAPAQPRQGSPAVEAKNKSATKEER